MCKISRHTHKRRDEQLTIGRKLTTRLYAYDIIFILDNPKLFC